MNPFWNYAISQWHLAGVAMFEHEPPILDRARGSYGSMASVPSLVVTYSTLAGVEDKEVEDIGHPWNWFVVIASYSVSRARLTIRSSVGTVELTHLRRRRSWTRLESRPSRNNSATLSSNAGLWAQKKAWCSKAAKCLRTNSPVLWIWSCNFFLWNAKLPKKWKCFSSVSRKI